MFIVDGIAHAGVPERPVRVSGVRPMADYKLWLRFNNGEARIFDFKPLLAAPAFAPLQDEATFREVYIDYGVTTWMDGMIDIGPDYLYENSEAVVAESA